MNYELKVFDGLCETEVFEINGVKANSSDFGHHNGDGSRKCSNMKFVKFECKQKVLDKYGITVDEYNKISDELVEGLSFGCCNYCQ